MWGRFSAFGRFYTSRSAEQFLLFGGGVSIAFFLLLYTTSYLEGVLTIDNGVGFYRNYGLFFALIGNSVVIFMARKYFDVVSASGEKCRSIRNSLYADLKAETESCIWFDSNKIFILYIYSILGIFFVEYNIVLQINGNTISHWSSDVFDSPAHPLSFVLNKLFMVYLWVFIIPWCAYSSYITSSYIGNISNIIENDPDIQYDLMDPDDAGGFSSFFYAKVFHFVGISILYLQVTVLTITFSTINVEHIFGYVGASLYLAFGNYFPFRRIDAVIEAKRVDALAKNNEMVYRGDALRLEIVRFHLEMFSQKSLNRRLFRAISLMKAVFILVPPVVNLLTKTAF